MTALGVARMLSEAADLGRLLTLAVGELFEAETAFRRAEGATVWGAVSASAVAPKGHGPYGICLVEDITSRKRAEAELQHMALHDLLTGLANRALFMDRMEQALAAGVRADSRGVGLIFLDLDGFKNVNDTWGHAQGDEVLRVAARRIEMAIRSQDTAARLGGDEFAVLCPGLSDVAQLRRVAERIRTELRRPIPLAAGGTYDQLSMSAGVMTSRTECSADALLQRADKLMYEAKRRGKDCVSIGEPYVEAAALPAVQLLPDLARATELEEFVVHFQPIVDLHTSGCVAAEALLRWDHPKRGLLGPDEFLTAAETSRHMSAIGRYALTEACRHAQLWTGAMAACAVHVNVSGRQLEVGDFRADVLAALKVSGLDPGRLVLELTETHAGRVAHSVKADLERLRAMGVRLAIDDVGTGFSSLAKIVDLPVDILKIDKQFIGGLPDDARCTAITKAVLSLGSSLGLAVIAEGVENRQQCDLLVELGCDLGQGFLFGRAMSAPDVLAYCHAPTPRNQTAARPVATPVGTERLRTQ